MVRSFRTVGSVGPASPVARDASAECVSGGPRRGHALVGCLVIALSGCSGRHGPVPVTDAAYGTNPQLELAAAVLREPGLESPAAQRGQAVVMGTVPCGTGRPCFSCFQCHGIRGEGGATAALPRLAGQDPRYLYRSLQEFASGQRANATMHDVAVGLTDQQKHDVSWYYSVVNAPAPLRSSENDAASSQAGLAIDQNGVPESGVPSCRTCHSAAAQAMPPRTNGPIYPYIDGQYADYIEQQLENFRAGNRRGEEAQIMEPIARGLSKEQSHAVAVHFAAKAPPERDARALMKER